LLEQKQARELLVQLAHFCRLLLIRGNLPVALVRALRLSERQFLPVLSTKRHTPNEKDTPKRGAKGKEKKSTEQNRKK